MKFISEHICECQMTHVAVFAGDTSVFLLNQGVLRASLLRAVEPVIVFEHDEYAIKVEWKMKVERLIESFQMNL